MFMEARICGTCDAVALPEQAVTVVLGGVTPATTHYFRCSKCKRQIRLTPTPALWLLGVLLVLCAWLIWLSPEKWLLPAVGGAGPLFVLLHSFYVLRRNPRVDPLVMALADPRIRALLEQQAAEDPP